MMNDFMVMEPTNLSFEELLGNGVRYQVPRFQRDYAWELEQWEDLWRDIQDLNHEKFHYMGYIVLQRKSPHDFEVIDGQQRLITLSLVVLAAMKQISLLISQGRETEQNKERLALLRARFIGAKNPVTLSVDNKLSLNRNNGTYFRSICSDLAAKNRRGMIQTNRQLQKGFDFFGKKMGGETGEELARFIGQLALGMMFTRIVVQDHLNAYKVFETLNARGVQLSTPDLLKNYLFSVVTQSDQVTDDDLNDLDLRWSGIVEQLGEANFTTFVRYHHNIQHRLTTQKDLFKAVRNLVTQPEQGHAYLNSLNDYAPVYGALSSPYDEFWQTGSNADSYRPVVEVLHGFDLFNIKQPFAILMAAYGRFDAVEFTKLARYLLVLSIRYNVICRKSTNEQEAQNNQMAMKIFDGTYRRASHVKNSTEYQRLYPKDDEFKPFFATHKMPSRQSSKKIRYLLAEIEQHLGHAVDPLSTVLEHVCPYHPEQHWTDYFGDGLNEVQDRLGNMVLLAKDHLKRAGFNEKKAAYAQSEFVLAKQVATYEQWDMQAVQHYQTWLAEQAVRVWRVD